MKAKKETDEERAIREEMEALQDEENRRKREEMSRIRLRQRQLNEEKCVSEHASRVGRFTLPWSFHSLHTFTLRGGECRRQKARQPLPVL